MEFQAPPELSLFIKRYFFLEVKNNISKKYRLFSNGNTGLVFALNDGIDKSKINNTIIPKAFVFGQITNTMELEIAPNTELLVIAFQPHGLHMLTDIPGKELTGSLVDADQVFGNHIKTLRNILIDSADRKVMVEHLNHYFLKIFLNKAPLPSLIPKIIDKIKEERGIISIQVIKTDFFIHERKLQRLFADQIGLTPKKYIQITRLQSFIEHINATPKNRNLTKLVFEAGYYDQPHLIKSFKSITGMTPSTYINSLASAVTDCVVI